MAHSPSAKKRIRQNAKRRALNRWRKRSFRDAIKTYSETILHGTVEQAEKELQELYKLLDKAASGSTIHPNAAARTKSRLTTKLNIKKASSAAA